MFLEKILSAKTKEIESIEDLIKKYKPSNVEKSSLINALNSDIGRIHVIAEIKRASPSTSVLKKDLNIYPTIMAYKNGGASAISVVTDKTYFSGSYDDIIQVKKITNLPVLAKDFIIHPLQIKLMKTIGADAILLIMRILDDEKYKLLYQMAIESGLEILVEVHSKEEIERAMKMPVRMIGINRRDLDLLKIEKGITEVLFKYLPDEVIKIAESGIEDVQDLNNLQEIGYDACLIGSWLIKSNNPEALLKSFYNLSTSKETKSLKPFVKVCGITNYTDAMKCIELGVYFIGFILADSPRRIPLNKVIEILSKLPKKAKTVAVFKNNPIDYVKEVIAKTNIDLVQLHGNEGFGYIEKISKPVIKSFDMTKEDVSETVKKYRGCVPLLDLPKDMPEEFRYYAAASISKRQPIMVAGKINLNNVERVINEVKPMTIDVCSGVEKEIGIKDHSKLEALMNKIRR